MDSKRAAAAAAVVLIAMGTAACGRKAPSATSAGSTTAASSPATNLRATTPAATGATGAVTWATYREVGTLDPIQAFDYPENTVISALCDSLLQQQADGTTKPGLATKTDTPNPHTIVFTINAGAKFWDGKNVTPEDVVYSLQRNHEPEARAASTALSSRT